MSENWKMELSTEAERSPALMAVQRAYIHLEVQLREDPNTRLQPTPTTTRDALEAILELEKRVLALENKPVVTWGEVTEMGLQQ